MIAHRGKDRTKGESDFKNLANYILRTGKPDVKQDYRITNCEYREPELMIESVLRTQERNTRSKADPCYHLVVSFCGNEKPDKETLAEIEDELCQVIGLSDHQRISVVHDDTDHFHLHIAINKVHPESHNMIEPFFDKLKLIDAAEQLEIKHDLLKHIDWEAARENRKNNYRAPDQATQAMKAHSGQLPFKDWVNRRNDPIKEAIDQAKSWEDLQKRLARLDLTIVKKGRGANLMARSAKTAIKLSDLGREYTIPKLEKRMGDFQAADNEIWKIKPVSKYSKPPSAQQLKDKAASTALWNDFQTRQKAKKQAIASIKAARKQISTELTLLSKQKRRLLKMTHYWLQNTHLVLINGWQATSKLNA